MYYYEEMVERKNFDLFLYLIFQILVYPYSGFLRNSTLIIFYKYYIVTTAEPLSVRLATTNAYYLTIQLL